MHTPASITDALKDPLVLHCQLHTKSEITVTIIHLYTFSYAGPPRTRGVVGVNHHRPTLHLQSRYAQAEELEF